MATIQIKRRTTAGTGPIVGSTGTVKAGEPLVDFNGGHLYISKADKTASVGTPLADSDYLAIPSVENVNGQIDTKITALSLGTAATKSTGTSSGNIPVLDSNGKLVDSVIPKVALTNTFVVASEAAMLALSTAQEGDVAVRTDLNKTYILKTTGYSTLANWQELLTPTDKVQSVNGKTGTVTVSLSDLGGVSSDTFTTHTGSNGHLTDIQRSKIDNTDNTRIMSQFGIASSDATDEYEYGDEVITGGLKLYSVLSETNNLKEMSYYFAIDKTKVLHPSSIIDGGTY